jgi:ATP-dependent RNA helicase DDX5/DBP2
LEDIHGNCPQLQQEPALLKFWEGKSCVLVATDVAACGLDVAGVEHVINMDLPMLVEAFDSYVHCIGYADHTGHMGLVTLLLVPELNDKIASKVVLQLKGPNKRYPTGLKIWWPWWR